MKTTVGTQFNLDATLSAPRSGAVTLYWSIDGSGFIHKQNGTMSNGKYSKAFEATSPGTYVFKVIWLGDSEYRSAESNNVTVTLIRKLSATLKTAPSTVYSGGTSMITTTLAGEEAPITGASISLASSGGGTFSAVTDQGNGTYISTYTAPSITTQTTSTISVTATKSGYQDASGQTQLTLQPLVIYINVKESDGTAIAGVTVTSTSQPSGQTTLSGNTDASGKVFFSNVLKGTYNFKASKSGYEEKTWITTVQQERATTETVTLTKSSGIPGYPIQSVVLALLVATVILYARARLFKYQ
jgi:hypothetical protein